MRILAIMCHPDDMEISCSGTLIKYKKQRHDVIACHAANGNMGHVEIMSDELREIRLKEAQKAEMLRCHESQIKWILEHDGKDLAETLKAMARARGLQCGVTYAEGFSQLLGAGRIKPYRVLP